MESVCLLAAAPVDYASHEGCRTTYALLVLVGVMCIVTDHQMQLFQSFIMSSRDWKS